MKLITIIAISILITSCNSKCPCSSDDIRIFNQELEGYHMRYIEDNEIACMKVEDFWFIKWDTIGIENIQEWDLIMDTEDMSQAGSITSYGLNGNDISTLRPFIRRIRANGFDLGYISSKDKSSRTYSSLVLGKNKGFIVEQTYYFKNGNWTLKSIDWIR